jgi:hypothetical protein
MSVIARSIDTSLVTPELVKHYGRALILQEQIKSKRQRQLDLDPKVEIEYFTLRGRLNYALKLDTNASPLDVVGPLTEFEDSIKDPSWKLLTKWDGWLRSAIREPSKQIEGTSE